MKTEISRDSHQKEKRYSGVYQQQGRMLTDADWNELVEILKERLNDALKDVVGSKEGGIGGTPRHRALKIIKASDSDPVTIQPGHVYVDGVLAEIPGSTNMLYDDQPDFPSPPSLPDPTGNYILYADIWERTVTHLMDEGLRDKGLHGADTCTRKQMMAQIKWCPDTMDPEQSTKNPSKGDSELTATMLKTVSQTDPCDPCAEQLDIKSMVGNYLFRVEIHDVKGDADMPTEITLKWSSDNGAEQFEVLPTKEEMPAGFISDKSVYEFFDEISEKHLGLHLATAFTPSREELTEGYPDAVPSRNFVRRWDGYCILDLSSKSLTKGMDRGVALSTSKSPDTSGYVRIDPSLQIILASIRLDMMIEVNKFVAGDYWLADVREAEHEAGSLLIENEAPQGIEHHYLMLGKVVGGVLQDNPEADRKYAFPPLTEMTRMFHAGGEGQEAMPGHELPHLIQVGVGNGEWSVEGAKLRFEIENPDSVDPGDLGSLLPPSPTVVTTDENGLAACTWTLGLSGRQRMKVSLLDPDDPSDSTELDHPPIYFNANLSTAENVAFTPVCKGDVQPTMHSLLGNDNDVSWPVLHDDHEHSTVKDVLDTFLCKLRASHIPFYPDECSEGEPTTVKTKLGIDTPTTIHAILQKLICELGAEDIPFDPEDCDSGVLQPTVKNGLGVSSRTTIHDVLQKLLCNLDAGIIPYDPDIKEGRWKDIKEISGAGPLTVPNTVQDAIDDLVENLESSDINYRLSSCAGAIDSVRRNLASLKDLPDNTLIKIDRLFDALLCELDASSIPYDRNSESGNLTDNFVNVSGDTMTGDLSFSAGDVVIGKKNNNGHRQGKIRLWQESNNADGYVSHAIGTEDFHNVYGAGDSYKNSIGHKFYSGGVSGSKELIAQIGHGGSGKPGNRLDSLFFGNVAISDKNHRSGKIRLWQESNNADEYVSHAIGTEGYHSVYGAGANYKNSIGHKFYSGGKSGEKELIAKIGHGGSGKPEDRLDSSFSGKVGIGTTSPSEQLEVKGRVKAKSFVGDGSQLTGLDAGIWSAGGGRDIYYDKGKVGIGTDSPKAELHVEGNIVASGAVFYNKMLQTRSLDTRVDTSLGPLFRNIKGLSTTVFVPHEIQVNIQLHFPYLSLAHTHEGTMQFQVRVKDIIKSSFILPESSVRNREGRKRWRSFVHNTIVSLPEGESKVHVDWRTHVKGSEYTAQATLEEGSKITITL